MELGLQAGDALECIHIESNSAAGEKKNKKHKDEDKYVSCLSNV